MRLTEAGAEACLLLVRLRQHQNQDDAEEDMYENWVGLGGGL